MSYATPADMLARYDARVIGDLVGDIGEQVPSAALESNAVLLTFLEEASGEVDVALAFGGRYKPEELQSLTGPTQQLLKRMVCDIAIANLMRRRIPSKPEELEACAAAAKRADEHLKKLHGGEEIFPLPAVVEATKAEVVGPSTLDYAGMQLTRDRTRHYFPHRVTPFGR